MRLIDADALHDALKAKQLWVVRCGDKHNEGYTYDQVHFAIDDAPSIDIVRCKECKKAHLTYDGDCKYCEEWKDDDGNYIEVYHDGDHFCSYGERNSSEKPNNCEPQIFICPIQDDYEALIEDEPQTERSE